MSNAAVVVCDEVGYFTYGADAANRLFHAVNNRHRKNRAMILHDDHALTGWDCLPDEDVARLIVDRISSAGGC